MRNDSDNTFRIAFTYERNGESYYSDSTVDICPGDTELDAIGDQFNAFLSQIGYVRENPRMFMADVNDDEHEALEQFLEDYRNGYMEARHGCTGRTRDMSNDMEILERLSHLLKKSGQPTQVIIPEPRRGM